MSDPNEPWNSQPDAVQTALASAWGLGVPGTSSALYARWWQLETWLRSLVYVELRAAFGTADWVKQLPRSTESRQAAEEEFRYMETPDAEATLAYTDARGLCSVIANNWELFSPSLPAKAVWDGRVVELLAIRNRIGHCRRSHPDDLARLEQTLRDLEGGARRATVAFNEYARVTEEWAEDPLVQAWVLEQDSAALRLVRHADRQYETTFELRASKRPWVEAWPEGGVTGRRGFLWHAFWYFRNDGHIDIRRLWEDIRYWHDSIIFVCSETPNTFEVSFSALDDPKTIADVIGYCFDLALSRWRRGPSPQGLYERWIAMQPGLDSRVHVLTPWTVVGDRNFKIRVFGA